MSLNLYTYCHNEPLMYADPTGNFYEPRFEGGKVIIRDTTDNEVLYNDTDKVYVHPEKMTNYSFGRGFKETFFADIIESGKNYGKMVSTWAKDPIDFYKGFFYSEEENAERYAFNVARHYNEHNYYGLYKDGLSILDKFTMSSNVELLEDFEDGFEAAKEGNIRKLYDGLGRHTGEFAEQVVLALATDGAIKGGRNLKLPKFEFKPEFSFDFSQRPVATNGESSSWRIFDNFRKMDLEPANKSNINRAQMNEYNNTINTSKNAGVGKVENIAKVRNGHLANDVHPVTKVPFDSEGFPKFDSKFDATLDESIYRGKDSVQFKESTLQLNKAIQENPELAKQFTPEQLKDIAKGRVPEDYTWHHNQQPGLMQLVDETVHAKTGHTGGRSIWGGGSDLR